MLEALGLHFAKKSIELIIDAAKTNLTQSKSEIERLEKRIGKHLVEVDNWSRRLEIFGSASAKTTENSTIPLRIMDCPRRFRGVDHDGITLNEKDIICGGEHLLLLGDPGSGKTTTLKRIARHFFSSPVQENDLLQYVLLIEFRKINTEQPIIVSIAQTLGFSCSVSEADKSVYAATVEKAQLSSRDQYHKENGVPVWEFLPSLLDSSGAFLLLDGLDEMPFEHRAQIEIDLEKLRAKLARSRIILTCRSGDYRKIEGFDSIEISPLSEDEKIEVIKLSHEIDYEDFILKTRSKFINELSSRPLFLSYLVLMYKMGINLEKRPTEIIKEIIKLQIKDWDAERKIERSSKYHGFRSDEKIEFLSGFAHFLTFRNNEIDFRKNSITFERRDLIFGYKAISEKFNLPHEEAEEVAAEIEAHNGLLVRVGFQTYQFSHLVIQEYLCAREVVREPIPVVVERYIKNSPHILAVAVALANNPDYWFARLVFQRVSDLDQSNIKALVGRVADEYPTFSGQPYLGAAVFKLLFEAYATASVELDRLIRIPQVRFALLKALNYYRVTKGAEDCWHMTRKDKIELDTNIEENLISKGGPIKPEIYKYIMEYSDDS